VASPWTVEIAPTAGAGLERLLEEHSEDAYRDALRDIIDLEENPTPNGAVLLRKTKADYRIYLYRALYRAVYRISPGRRKVIVLRVGPRGGGIYPGYEKWRSPFFVGSGHPSPAHMPARKAMCSTASWRNWSSIVWTATAAKPSASSTPKSATS